jgi:hypothetical protein
MGHGVVLNKVVEDTLRTYYRQSARALKAIVEQVNGPIVYGLQRDNVFSEEMFRLHPDAFENHQRFVIPAWMNA